MNANENGLIPIACSFDMGWQKRGKGHNSRSGHAAVMSLMTGKVLDYDYAKRSNKVAKVYDCCKNHIASKSHGAFPSN